VLVATLVLCLPLLRHRPDLPSGNDVLFAAQSTLGFAEALREGVVFPRWVASSNAGLGAPTFVFYSPLAYYASGLASVALGDALAGLRWTVVAMSLLAGLAFVLACRRGAAPALLAAAGALYVLAPYHALDLYWRFALAEYAAFVWIPLLFLFARRVLEGGGASGMAGLALVYAGLVLTHVVTAFLAPLALAPYALMRSWSSGRWPRLAALAAAGGLGVALAAIYVVPMGVQRSEVQLEHVVHTSFGDYRRNFVLRDETAHGFEAAPIKSQVNHSALAQGLLAATALALGVRRRRDAPGTGGSERGRSSEAWALGGVVLWTTFLQLPLSEPVWRLVPELPTVQFPWRFQVFQAFAACALVAQAPLPGDWSEHRTSRAGALALALASATMLWVSGQALPPQGLGFGPEELRRPAARGAVMFEYVPSGVPFWTQWPGLLPGARAWLDGPGEVRVEHWGTHRRVVRVESAGPGRLGLRTFHHPGWTARIDGVPAPVRASGPLRTQEVSVPAGSHTVEVALEATPGERLGAAVSAAALLATLLLLRTRPRRPSPPPPPYST
jgi:hypothetical protein